MSPLLEARRLSRSFLWRGGGGRGQRLQALDRIDLDVGRGECLGLVGESGSGKTTLGRCLLRLLEPDAGEIRFDGVDLTALSRRRLRRLRTQFQMVFQDSAGALDPRLRVGALVAEPLRVHRLVPRAEIDDRVRALLDTVGLAAALARRYPHQLSGGQRQRVGIARALATRPRLLILDEPVSALDVSVRAQILGLLDELRRRLSLTLIFIAHDLAMVEQIADRVAVMYLGRLVEIGPASRVLGQPRHPYTESLLRAIPVPDPARRSRLAVVRGEVPSPLEPPPGCAFHPRCARARGPGGELRARCGDQRPRLRDAGADAAVACHYPAGGPPADAFV